MQRTGLPSVDIKLGTPRTIQGRVVDRDGSPLAGIQVTVVYWRRLHTLDWKAETGTDGRFRWENAPREEVWLNVFGNGFIGVQNRVVPATETETVIKLARTLRVTGTVVNYRTRKPIESFMLQVLESWFLGSATGIRRDVLRQPVAVRSELVVDGRRVESELRQAIAMRAVLSPGILG